MSNDQDIPASDVIQRVAEALQATEIEEAGTIVFDPDRATTTPLAARRR